MKRINVTFYDEIYEKIAARAEKNRSKSIAEQVRELVELGLKIEAVSESQSTESQSLDQEHLLSMLKNNLVWALETRLLARYLVERLPENDKQNHIEILDKYREKASDYVEGMLDARAK